MSSLRSGKGALQTDKVTPARQRALTQKSRIARMESKHYSGEKTYTDKIPF